jgi:polysaccharide export outer membrane protein
MIPLNRFWPGQRVLASVFAIVLLGFSGGAARAATTNANVPGDYLIRVGDTLSISVYNELTLTQPALRVLPGGTIAVPLAGEVRVAGLTTGKASLAVAKALAKYVRDPNVTVAVALVGPVDVLVLGNVKLPGKYSLQPESRLTDALAAAGGLGPTDGDLPVARLQNADGSVKEISLQDLLHEGNVALNVGVSNEMTVYVPSPLTLNVQIFGAVDHPGDVLLHQGDRVLAAIARAGTSPQLNPDLNKVVVRRSTPDGKSTVQTINVYEIVKSEDVSKDIVLQKGDIVYVPQAGKHINGADLLGTILGIGRLVVP